MKVHLEFLPPNTTNHEMIWGSIGLLAILAVRFVPFSLFPKLPCTFHRLTGYPCPSCGMTRSFIYMSHFKFWAAMTMNPLGGLLFIFTVIFVIYAFITCVFRIRRICIATTKKSEGLFIRIAVIFAIVANWVYLIIVNQNL